MTMPSVTLSQWPVRSYVNREQQVSEISDAIRRARTLGSVFLTLYEWYGSPGIGKSTLISLLRGACEDLQATHVHVDFHGGRNPHAQEYSLDQTTLIEALLQGLKGGDDAAIHQAIKEYRLVSSTDSERKTLALNKAARLFLRYVGDLAEKDPVVLLFDETERAKGELVDWMEEWIISPLVQNGRCLIIWTGRRPQRWKRFEVRRRLRSQELDVFDEEATAKLFRQNSKYHIDGLVKPVRQITGGHPLALTIAMSQLDALAEKRRVPKFEHLTDADERHLLNGLVDELIDKYAFVGLQPEITDACRAMSLVRQFDVILLREILTKTVKSFSGYAREEFGGVLSRLRTTQLVLWDDRRKGYAIDPTLRRLLSAYKRSHDPKGYAEANRIAIGIYQDWIKNAGDNRGVYIVEELYHQACLNSVSKEGVNLKELLKKRLSEYPINDPDLYASALDRLYHEVERDLELSGLVRTQAFDALLDMIKKTRLNSI